MTRRSSLGRGLAALIPDDVMEARPQNGSKNKVLEVPLAQIQPNPEQPRTHFDPQALSDLCSSIQVHGIIQPLLVRSKAGGGYVLIAGERRLRAAGLLQRESGSVASVDKFGIALFCHFLRHFSFNTP